MIEEWLFRDNQTYMNQIGLGKYAEGRRGNIREQRDA
jgi:hypothetical protein